jgi:small nuclear ribonucleoprotein (snRNP)-like protein
MRRPVPYHKALRRTLRYVLSLPEFKFDHLNRISKSKQIIQIVMKSGRTYQGKPRSIQNQFQKSLSEAVYINYLVYRLERNISKEISHFLNPVILVRNFSRYTLFDYYLYKIFKSWRKTFKKQYRQVLIL